MLTFFRSKHLNGKKPIEPIGLFLVTACTVKLPFFLENNQKKTDCIHQ
jgi:hypothetical protein